MLYIYVGWEPLCAAQVRTALQNSLATFTVFEEGKPVGMVRLTGDGGMSFYIKDLRSFRLIRAKESEMGLFVHWIVICAILTFPSGRLAWN